MSESAQFTRRIVDNTLPQSAFHFLVCRERRCSPLDPAARVAFDVFVDTFINSPVRVSALPGKDAGVGDAFVRLWQSSADEVGRNLGPASTGIDDLRLLDAFGLAVARSPQAWSGWLRLQLTHEISQQYRSRVIDWRDRLDRSVIEIRAQTSKLNRARNERIVRFRDDVLAGPLGPVPTSADDFEVDFEYRVHISRLGTDLATFATAYGYDWYRRGYAYG